VVSTSEQVVEKAAEPESTAALYLREIRNTGCVSERNQSKRVPYESVKGGFISTPRTKICPRGYGEEKATWRRCFPGTATLVTLLPPFDSIGIRYKEFLSDGQVARPIQAEDYVLPAVESEVDFLRDPIGRIDNEIFPPPEVPEFRSPRA